LKVKVTRSLFESMVQPLIDRSLEPCRKCIKDAGLTTKEIQEARVLLVLYCGGLVTLGCPFA
jgi:molecular chaperone DnaK (HSP70)